MNSNILEYLMSNPTLALWMASKDVDICSKAVCALANTNGGCIVVGINDGMEIVGVDMTGHESFVEQVYSNIKPQPPFSVTAIAFKGKNVILINVWEGNRKPYTTHDAFYVLRGDTICRASLDDISTMSRNTYELSLGWERQVVASLDMSDLAQGVINRFKSILLESKRIHSDNNDTLVLQKLGFLSKNMITNAGAVMLCESPAIYLPQTRIRVSVFGYENKLLDVHLYDSNLLDAVDQIVDYIGKLYPKRIAFSGLERFEEETLPILALREGLLNACVHRSYDNYESFVAVNIYKDYLEIVNSGGLPGNLKVSDLSVNHLSVLRNPDIANAFYTVKYIEMAGSGTLRIIDECKRCNCEPPVWNATDDMVVLRFNNVRHAMLDNTTEETVNLNSVSSDVSVRNELVKILNFMKTHENVKLSDIACLLNKSYPSVKRYMRLLTDAALIEYIGNNRSGGWYLK